LKKNIVLLSTADWDNPFWTNKQYVALELSKMGYKVFYIDSLGLRRPTATAQDFNRILKRIKKSLKPPRRINDNLWVWSPILLPFQSNRYVRKFNYFLLNNWLNFWLYKLGIKKDIFWTYNPLTLDLFKTDEYKILVYHCVDEIKAQPGMPVEILEKAEENLCKKSDVIFTTSRNLYETRKILNKNTHYFSNVADYNHFSKAMDENTKIPEDLLKISSPRIGFIGAISSYKLDFKLIEFLAKKMPNYSFIFIGKIGEGDPWTNVDHLKKYHNIYFLGPKDYKVLPNYLKGLEVTILPNNINEYTKSMFPMKFFEYLAAGKPIVSVNLDSLKEFKNVCLLSDTYEEFAKNIEFALKNPKFNIEKRIEIAKKFTYSERMKKMMEIVEGLK
jgi:glycosyltransferase involved in cell wall biosynthesis